jgi:hypothetical protein
MYELSIPAFYHWKTSFKISLFPFINRSEFWLISRYLGSFVNGTTIALISPRFKRRTMFLTGAIGMLGVYISWLVAVRYAVKALDAGTTNKAAGIAVLFFIYFYSPVRNHSR